MRLIQTSKRPLAAVLFLGLAMGAAACGSGSTTIEETGTEPQSSKPSVSNKGKLTPRPHRDSGGGSEGFRVKGGDNSIQEYGGEVSGAEFTAAATALHGYLDARAMGAWTAACGYLERTLVIKLVEFAPPDVGQGDCPKALEAISAGVPPSVLREAAQVDVAALRLKGASGFLLLRDEAGDGYFIAMSRKGGGWKVGAPAASLLPGG